MRLPPGVKIRGGFRLNQLSKRGKIINSKGAFGQSSYQRLTRQLGELLNERPDSPKTTITGIGK